MRIRILYLALAMAAVPLLFATAAFGQAVTGSITGYVTDPTGGAIPGASVTATEVKTGVATTRTSDASGLYLITNLLPGTYSVSIGAKGFKTVTQQQVQLEVGATVRSDVRLELG